MTPRPRPGTKVVASREGGKYHLETCGTAKNIKAENQVSRYCLNMLLKILTLSYIPI